MLDQDLREAMSNRRGTKRGSRVTAEDPALAFGAPT
jgi:hypothetical protein